MKFGVLKSKIENKLVTAYTNGKLNEELKKFKSYILNEESLSSAYHIYNELSTQKGWDKHFAENYLEECVDIFRDFRFNKETLMKLEDWVKSESVENVYEDIDKIMYKDVLIIENIVKSKENIISVLTSSSSKKEHFDIPVSKLYEVAQENMKKYVSQLDESDLKELNKYLGLSEEEIGRRYDILSELAITKLNTLSENSDEETKSKIKETIKKIETEKPNSVNLIKLKNLNANL